MNLGLRLRCAWDGFLGAPAPRFYVVEQVGDIGWFILDECRTYDRARDLAGRYSGAPVRVMVSTEWERRTLEAMRNRDMWLALIDMRNRLQRAVSDVRDLQTIQKSNLLDSFMQRKHP